MIEELDELDELVIKDGLSDAAQNQILEVLSDDSVWETLVGRMCRTITPTEL